MSQMKVSDYCANTAIVFVNLEERTPTLHFSVFVLLVCNFPSHLRQFVVRDCPPS